MVLGGEIILHIAIQYKCVFYFYMQLKKENMKKLYTLLALVAYVHIVNAQPCITNSNSLFFNGTSSYVSLASQTGLNITDSITVEAWIYSTQWGATSALNTIVCKHGWSQGEAGFVLRAGAAGQLSFNFGGLDQNGLPTSWIDNISVAGTLTLNTWHHVAGTFDGTNSKIYINGTLAGTTPFVGSIVPSPSYPLTIGRLCDPGQAASRYFSGYMDEIRIWNRALSQAEIQAQMNDHIDPIAVNGLVSYWRMNNGSGTAVTDLTGANAGIVNSATWAATVPFNNAPPPTPVAAFNGIMLASNAPSNNQWYLNGVLITGATNNTYIPVQNGVYTVVVTAANGCSATSNAVTITTVSIEEVNKMYINLYPNPVNDILTIDVSGIKEKMINYIITGLTGKQILSGTVNSKKFSVDTRNLSDGIYFINLNSRSSHIVSRFAKQ